MSQLEPEEGIVVSSHRNRVVIFDCHTQPITCTWRRGKERPIAGDRVIWQPTNTGDGQITAVLPRHSLVFRPVEHGTGKPIAANVDLLVLVIAPAPAYLTRLIDRYLVVATYLDIPVGLIFNKIDLLNEESKNAAQATLAPYQAINLPIFWTSTKMHHGFDRLSGFLRSRSSILIGQSGVGKSSLTKLMTVGFEVDVQALSNRGATGRHTTSRTTLYPLPGQGWIIDSPGVREFALWHIPTNDIAGGFAEFRPYLGQCQFRDCRHDTEPGCAITNAVNRGVIPAGRHESYREMVREA